MWWALFFAFVLSSASDDELELKHILPMMGPTSGNTRVTVWAKGITPNAHYPDAKCRFGTLDSDIVSAVVAQCTPKPKTVDDPDPTREQQTSWCLRCKPNHEHEAPEKVAFSVTIVGDFSDVKNTLPYTFYTPAVVESIKPIYGPK
jgi:hypothetical protein